MAFNDLFLVITNPVHPVSGGGFSGTTLLLEQGPDDPSPQTLGFVIAVPNVPRWMSAEFADALAEHDAKTINIKDYPSDWLEQIFFITSDDLDPTKNFENAAKTVQWSIETAALGPSMDHPLAFGCGRLTPRVRVRSISFDQAGDVIDTKPYSVKSDDVFYAIVNSKVATADSITIAPLSARPAFVASQRHKDQLALAAQFRQQVDPHGDLAKLRGKAFDAIKAFSGEP